MVDESFVEHLEYALTHAFANSNNELLKGFWCDGVIIPDMDTITLQKRINDQRELTTMMFAGKTGQDEYELTIRFGRKALSRNARGLELITCIPSPENEDWYEVNEELKKATIQLH